MLLKAGKYGLWYRLLLWLPELFLLIISNNILWKSIEGGHLCLVPIYEGQCFHLFSIADVAACWFISYNFYNFEVCSFHTYFIVKEHRSLSNAYSASIKMILWFLLSILLMCFLIFIDLQMLSQSYISGKSSFDHDG